MMNWGFSDVEVLACFFMATAVPILIGLKMIIGPSPQRMHEYESSTTTINPRRLGAVEDEGFEVVELYDDLCTLEEWFRGCPPKALSSCEGQAVRTAKVRNPDSGEVKLIRVLDRAGRIH